MSKKELIICLLLALLVSGCGEGTTYTRGISRGTTHQQNFPFLPNEIGVFPIFVPGLILVMKSIDETNAIMEFERKADAEFAEMKNPVWFVRVEERQSVK